MDPCLNLGKADQTCIVTSNNFPDSDTEPDPIFLLSVVNPLGFSMDPDPGS